MHYTVLIIGSGFGAISAAHNLLKEGITDFLMLERRSFMGGTWCQNTYPGAQVDVQSPLYSLSFRPYVWSRLYAKQEELQTYTQWVIDDLGLRAKCHTNTEVKAVSWQEDINRWKVVCANDKCYTACFVINASGPLSTPVIPSFEGRETFEGQQFHTNAWDHSFDYANKRVAVIGSGASAIQVIPAIANDVEALHVFQRTPHWVMSRPEKIFSPWFRRLLNQPWINKAYRLWLYGINELRVIGFKYAPFILRSVVQKHALRHMRKQVKDRAMQKALTPSYTIGCKRILLSNSYYPALTRTNVFLHTAEDGIERINEEGIVTKQGHKVALDAIVYATGFDATDGVISYSVTGRDGLLLQDFWKEYPRAYLGTAIPKFPNFFVVTGPNTGIGHTSALFMMEAQMPYIMRCINTVLHSQKKSIEVKPAAEEEYTEEIHREMERTVWKQGGCQSWYQSKSGKVVAMFPGFTFTYARLARRFKASHHMLSG